MSNKKAFIGLIVFLFSCSFALGLAGVSYDLSTAAYDITGGSQINSMLADEKHHIVYIGTNDNKFGYYNETSNSTVVLTSIMSGWTYGEYWGMALDDDKNIIYVTNGQDPQWFGYYNLTSNTSTFIGNEWTYFTRIIFDKERYVLWYASDDGDLGYINLTDMTKVFKAWHGSGYIPAWCKDDILNRIYGGSALGARIPFYFSIDNESIVNQPELQTDILSCDISYDWHYIYFSAGGDFQFSTMLNPVTEEINVMLYSGDLNNYPDIQYMQQTKTVAMAEVSVFSPDLAGRIYNITSNTTSYIRDGDLDDWMDSYYMTDGDYMNTSRRYYFGFSNGMFGYYDNTFVDYPMPSSEFQTIVTDFVNNSEYELKEFPLSFNAKFVSGNETTMNITILINGTYEDSVVVGNNTWYAFDISSIATTNETGDYILTIFTKYATRTYYFTVIENFVPISNSSYIAVAILLVASVFIFAYLGSNTENEILKLLFCTTATIATAGLSHSAMIIASANSLSTQLINIIGWFTWAYLLISLFIFVYFVYLLIVFMLSLIADMKAGNSIFQKKQEEKNDPFR